MSDPEASTDWDKCRASAPEVRRADPAPGVSLHPLRQAECAWHPHGGTPDRVYRVLYGTALGSPSAMRREQQRPSRDLHASFDAFAIRGTNRHVKKGVPGVWALTWGDGAAWWTGRRLAKLKPVIGWARL